jgi:hypothetical protein
VRVHCASAERDRGNKRDAKVWRCASECTNRSAAGEVQRSDAPESVAMPVRLPPSVTGTPSSNRRPATSACRRIFVLRGASSSAARRGERDGTHSISEKRKPKHACKPSCSPQALRRASAPACGSRQSAFLSRATQTPHTHSHSRAPPPHIPSSRCTAPIGSVTRSPFRTRISCCSAPDLSTNGRASGIAVSSVATRPAFCTGACTRRHSRTTASSSGSLSSAASVSASKGALPAAAAGSGNARSSARSCDWMSACCAS